MNVSTTNRGFVAILLSAIGYGSFGVWITIINEDLGSFQQIFFRYLLASLFVVAVLLFKKTAIKREVLFSKDTLLLGVVFPFGIIFYTLSILFTKIALATFSFYMAAFTASLIIGAFVFNEKLTKLKFISLMLAIIGLIMFSNPFSGNLLNWGVLLGLLAGLLDVVSNGFRKHLAERMDRIIIAAVPMAGGIVISGAFAMYFKQSLFFADKLTFPSISAAIISGGLLVLFNYLLVIGFQYFDLNLGTIVLSSEILFASAFGWIFLNQRLTVNEIVGGLIVATAVSMPEAAGYFRWRKREAPD